jgi:N-acyl-D-amino-acid deacylase
MGYDLVIKDGRIVDGTGGPWFKGDIAIEGAKIAKVGGVDLGEADDVIDAGGLVVSPGFIDIHCHSDFSLLDNPEADSFSRQGITTVINGNCGFSAAPVSEAAREVMGEIAGTKFEWTTLDGYLSKMGAQGVAINSGTYTGLANLRTSTMGLDAWDRTPTDAEMGAMKVLLAESMRDGSFGLSSGLEYPPQTIVETRELLELCEVAAAHGGIYSTHIRSRDVKVVAAAREAIEIGEKTGIPVQGAHWGARFPSDGKTKFIVDMVVEARERGVDIAFDQAPWTVDGDGIGWCGCSLLEPIAAGSKYTDKGRMITLEMLRDPEVV